MDRRAAASLDRWITRESPYDDGERPLLKCSGCGRFLVEEPFGTREFVAINFCTGEPKVIECKYGEVSADESVLAIIGEEFRGKTYRFAHAPACGSMKGSVDQTYDGEISPEDAEQWKHAPHWFIAAHGYSQSALRWCTCGKLNEEVLL